jgi:hypothetical protein
LNRLKNKIVMPAKAGIQCHRRDVGVCGRWIPAFAGMTIEKFADSNLIGSCTAISGALTRSSAG